MDHWALHWIILYPASLDVKFVSYVKSFDDLGFQFFGRATWSPSSQPLRMR